MSVNKKRARKAAQKILEEFSMSKIPIPVDRIAKKLGAIIRYSPMDNEELSGMMFVKNDIPIIGVNALHHPNRQRFTIAHELGHFVLHRAEIEREVHIDTKFSGLMRDQKSADGIDDLEIEANSFASELLMPLNIISQVIDEVVGDQVFDIESDPLLDEIAAKFKVSRQAMQLRLMALMA